MPEDRSLRVRQEVDDFLEWLCEHPCRAPLRSRLLPAPRTKA
jgi:hypothetical protein